MAMSEPSDLSAVEGLPEDLDGHTIEELSDYLDRGLLPRDPTIDASPGSQLALRALTRLRAIAGPLLDSEAASEEPRDDNWIATILSNIGQEARAGRDIPLAPPSPDSRLSITEGAVRGMIRGVGDSLGSVLVGRVRLEGDVTAEGEPVTIQIDATVFWGTPIAEATERLRLAVLAEIARHTELVIAGVDITVHDVTVAEPRSTGAVLPPKETS
jgi:uncharacterized alkaline shock family protein YloU